ncbi:MAG: methyltransferase [Chitinophagaceae bacterium]|nr:methyltransferase [Chitinophagaceae bacterium]
MPVELLGQLTNTAGFDRTAFEGVHESGRQITSIRVNDAKWNDEIPFFQTAGPVPWCEHGRYLEERPSFTHDPLFHAGVYYVQEASSMFLWQALKTIQPLLKGPLRILDLCAAPGGKTTLLSSFFKDDLVVSNEIIRSRSNVLYENVVKWGNDNVVVTNNDPADFKRLEGFFDVIVADAPCSGSGLFRKDPSAIEEWSEENVNHCSQRQQRILADVLPCLRSNGILIYSTCSYSEKENEDIADWLVEEFNLQSIEVVVDAGWNIVVSSSQKTNAYGYRFYPDKVKGEGFYLSVFQKKEGSDFSSKTKQLNPVTKTEAAIAMKWLNTDELFLFPQQDNILGIRKHWVDDLYHLQQNLYLKKAGIAIGSVKHKDLVPSHELAMSHYLNRDVDSIDADKEQALQYLKKKDMTFSSPVKGWKTIQYCGVNLGWIKNLHNRVNNYYPSEWRILKD